MIELNVAVLYFPILAIIVIIISMVLFTTSSSEFLSNISVI